MADSMKSEVVIQGIANDIAVITTQIEEARKLIQFAKDAGITVTQQEADLRSLEIQREKWQRTLDSRGVKPQ